MHSISTYHHAFNADTPNNAVSWSADGLHIVSQVSHSIFGLRFPDAYTASAMHGLGKQLYHALQDPVDGSPAVLVMKWNITSEKQLELQLEASHEALQRYT